MAILLCLALFTHEIPARHASIMMPDHDHKMDSKPEMYSNHEMSRHMEHSHSM
jgi:hypothetical protein